MNRPGRKLWEFAQEYLHSPKCDPEILKLINRTLKRLGYPELDYEKKDVAQPFNKDFFDQDEQMKLFY